MIKWSKTQKVQTWLTGALLMILGILTMLYWGSRKEVWFCDEIYTYESANGFEQSWPAELVSTWQTGEEVESYFAADWDRFSLKSISDRLYNDHVPLYFWIFRIFSVLFFPGSGSIWIGMSMNVIFFLAIIGIVYTCFVRLTGKPAVSGIATALTCLSTRLLLEQATTLRMYAMLLLLQILLLLAERRLLKDAREKRNPTLTMLYLYAVSLAGFLTHYHFWVYFAVTAAFTCGWLGILAIRRYGRSFLKSRECCYVYLSVGNFALTLVSTILLFPYCRWNLNQGKGQTALHSIFDFSGEKIRQILWGYERMSVSIFGDFMPVWLGLILIFGCIGGGGYLLYRRQEKHQLTGLVLTVLVCQAYQLAVCFTMPAGWEERYLWGVFAMMLWCAVWGGILLSQEALRYIRGGERRGVWKIVTACALSSAVLAGNIAAIDGGDGIVYLQDANRDTQALKEREHLPWLVYGPTMGVYSYFDWLIPEEICFLTEEETAEDVAAAVAMEEKAHFVLYVNEDYKAAAEEFLEKQLGSRYELKYVTTSAFLTVYDAVRIGQ